MANLIEKNYLSPPEIAEVLRVSPIKVLRWIATGDLRASDLASYRGQRPRWRISRDDLAAFLERRAQSPTPKGVRRRRKRRDAGIIEFYK